MFVKNIDKHLRENGGGCRTSIDSEKPTMWMFCHMTFQGSDTFFLSRNVSLDLVKFCFPELGKRT